METPTYHKTAKEIIASVEEWVIPKQLDLDLDVVVIKDGKQRWVGELPY